MQVSPPSLLVIAPPGVLRNAWISSLRSHLQFSRLETAGSLDQARTLLSFSIPDLILLDAVLFLPGTSFKDLQQVLTVVPAAHFLAVVDTPVQETMAKKAGIPNILLREHLDDELHPAILSLQAKFVH